MNALETKSLTLAYGDQVVIENLDHCFPKGKISVLIGSNGSGKSTLLRSLARLLKPREGSVILDGKAITTMSTKAVAREMALLPQSPECPEGLTVLQLVKQGRYPYQNWMQQWSNEDERAVKKALKTTNLEGFEERPVDSLSGGQRQRVWIAMVLAQETDTILLDEPTTYLDLSHQLDILDLLYELNRNEGRTIIMVLHDLNLSARYADNMVVVHDKTVFAHGKPDSIITPELVKKVFGIECLVMKDPVYGKPLCIPCGKGRRVENENLRAVDTQ
ncbi:iron complex transport system ATP-binding protein [Planifilum fimeticola]|uniref:Iron complex transport system ATP-binding protein n=1 Tax=Planifilum fimeticola TaxID=201975 RepID=A0A2T0LAB3_9BACL|nr:ABC transporter ATP-binding protein [Planifilum fimeticola]PRX38756.1 iron complex transport system ATP-binding protein [Planifilum fimeticola]